MASRTSQSDLVKHYLESISRFSLLTHEQEITLGKQVQAFMAALAVKESLVEETGESPSIETWAEAADVSTDSLQAILEKGQRAKSKMVQSNLRLVVSVAKKYLGNRVEFMDLIQEGTIGLHRGVEKFDPTKGYRFSTYAYWWIRQGITRAIADNSRTIRLPIHINEKLTKLRREERQFLQANGRPAKLKELAKALDCSVDQVRQLKKISVQPLSLDMRIGANKDTELSELLEDDAVTPEEYAIQNTIKSEVRRLVWLLPEQQKTVVRMRFGLDGGKSMTLVQIGEQMGISRERVRQIERAAMVALRRKGGSIREFA